MASVVRPPIGHWINPLPRVSLLFFVQKHTGLSDDEIRRLGEMGALYINGERASVRSELKLGDYVRAHLSPRRFPVTSIPWLETLRFEDDHYVVIEKPVGIPVHATVDNHLDNVLVQVSAALGYSLCITQRLDRTTSGLMVLAKTIESQRRFNQDLSDRKIEKIYRALTDLPLPLGRHTHYMRPARRSPRIVTDLPEAGWKLCELEVTDCRSFDGGFENVIRPLTGRTHQIRAQASALGAPLRGDTLYGAETALSDGSVALHSSELRFLSQGKLVQLTSRPPWHEA